MNGTLDVLREIEVVKKLLREFGVGELVVEGVTGQTTWDEIKGTLDCNPTRFMEFMTVLDRQLDRIIPEDWIAQNWPLEDLLLSPLAA